MTLKVPSSHNNLNTEAVFLDDNEAKELILSSLDPGLRSSIT